MPLFSPNPALYWIITYGLCWLLVGAVIWFRPKLGLVMAAALGLMFLLRLPSIVFDNEINPDESQMITQALTLRQDPVYFRSVDGTTAGPLDSYTLVLPSLLGLPFDYITAHLTAFLLIAISLWLVTRTARLWYGETAAIAALLPLIFILGMTQVGDFLHYSSELVPVLLLSLSYYLYATLLAQKRSGIARIFLIGILLGMVPFGKLQAVPLAAVVGLFVGIHILLQSTLTVSAKIGRLIALGAGAILFPLLFVGFMWISGVYNDFVTFYIVGNLKYGSDTNQLETLLQLPAYFYKSGPLCWFIVLALLSWLVGSLASLRRSVQFTQASFQQTGFITLLFLATLFSVTRTGSGYLHYLFFLMGPLLLGMAYGWSQLQQVVQHRSWLGLGASVLILLGFGAQVVMTYKNKQPINPYPSIWQNGWVVQQSPVSKEVRKYAQPGEKLVVWGWRCDYYVQAQMPQGVNENHTIRSAFEHPLLETYQQRYVRDFIRSTPPVFVDAVGKFNLWMTDRATQGHEMIKPLGDYVRSNYTYVGLINDARIYVRNDRARLNK
ncbi:hypothetical protein [Spirosoma pomorum]